MEIQKSTIVQSVAGHDKGSLYYVIEIDGVYALLVNGKNRRNENPKRKTFKHLRFKSEGCGTASEKLNRSEYVTNKEIRKGLAEFAACPVKNMEVCKFG